MEETGCRTWIQWFSCCEADRYRSGDSGDDSIIICKILGICLWPVRRTAQTKSGHSSWKNHGYIYNKAFRADAWYEILLLYVLHIRYKKTCVRYAGNYDEAAYRKGVHGYFSCKWRYDRRAGGSYYSKSETAFSPVRIQERIYVSWMV